MACSLLLDGRAIRDSNTTRDSGLGMDCHWGSLRISRESGVVLELVDDVTLSSELAAREPSILQLVAHAAHILPSQGPITVFVHHNTLHAFESLGFDEGVQTGGRLYGCHAYLPEERYRAKLQRGRIRLEDLEAVLQEDLGDEADRLIGTFGTRYALRLAMLQFPLYTGTPHELRWVVAETDALRKFRKEVELSVRLRMLSQTREKVEQRLTAEANRNDDRDVLASVLQEFDGTTYESWSESKWEAILLNYLWRVCCDGVRQAGNWSSPRSTPDRPVRHRDVLLAATGQDADLVVHDTLIRFCSSFLDQGFADWDLPERQAGLFHAFLQQYALPGTAPTRWFSAVRREAKRILERSYTAVESIEESLQRLGIEDDQREEFITRSLLALRGWAGMIWQMETNAEWTLHPAPAGTLVEFLAVRLMLDRLALQHLAGLDDCVPLSELRRTLENRGQNDDQEVDRNDFDRRAFTVFQLAQVRGWAPTGLQNLAREQWNTLVGEIEAFHALERRRVFHRAFERKYRNATLDAVITHSKRVTLGRTNRPLYQVACCIDEREESFRRHQEEVQPECETFGIAGFFGVAMYYRGAADAHFTPLCPVNIKPAHYVVESPVYSAVELERRRADARRRIGKATHRTHRVTRSLFGGAIVGVLGSLAAFPLVARILFPRLTSQIRRLLGSIVNTSSTELRLERLAEEPGSENGNVGYSIDEMVNIVDGGLRAIGLAKSERMSRLVIICGHGSASLNNPHEAAHDCGACGGGRGGPNARAFAQMANDPRVRSMLRQRGITIPDSTYFVGAYHNTCDDSMTWYDLNRVPLRHRELFEQAKADVDEARKRSSHERCRRFESADVSLTVDEALRHVEGRAEDLSQTRPEYGHATNALCFVGRRSWSRGLFLDRRAFLTSYDPTQDDESSSTLERLLQAVIPVCAGINLEYYFSYVDPTGYGCGTKLPHNVTSLLGVMDGAASDLRPGLPWQMVEIHEPVRLLFVVETSCEAMMRIIEDNETISRLVMGEWVQLAVFDPETQRMHRFVRGEFLLYAPHEREIPTSPSSVAWYGGHRDHLGYASIGSTNDDGETGVKDVA